ncbi:hypothetical protein EAX62_10990 [Tessaracoccus antarcticus]|uniref:Uncharacterized protein n=2 Tax=Tessaracoccus antarcticus TaxID=2479848 RepID=A0A3M0GGD5_9ACTN|nr:hypothetical protein EAX62_10990 [Tessaracoccus antarcticus]
MQQKGGTWAEYAVVRADASIVVIPEGLSFEQAAALPVAGNTALKIFHVLTSVPHGGSLFVAATSSRRPVPTPVSAGSHRRGRGGRP